MSQKRNSLPAVNSARNIKALVSHICVHMVYILARACNVRAEGKTSRAIILPSAMFFVRQCAPDCTHSTCAECEQQDEGTCQSVCLRLMQSMDRKSLSKFSTNHDVQFSEKESLPSRWQLIRLICILKTYQSRQCHCNKKLVVLSETWTATTRVAQFLQFLRDRATDVQCIYTASKMDHGWRFVRYLLWDAVAMLWYSMQNLLLCCLARVKMEAAPAAAEEAAPAAAEDAAAEDAAADEAKAEKPTEDSAEPPAQAAIAANKWFSCFGRITVQFGFFLLLLLSMYSDSSTCLDTHEVFKESNSTAMELSLVSNTTGLGLNVADELRIVADEFRIVAGQFRVFATSVAPLVALHAGKLHTFKHDLRQLTKQLDGLHGESKRSNRSNWSNRVFTVTMTLLGVGVGVAIAAWLWC